MRRGAWLGIVWLVLGCAPAAVDYAGLENAAAARQRWSDGQSAVAQRDAQQLLKQPLTSDAAARVALLRNRSARAAAEELGVAQAELASVKRLPNPTLEGALRFHGEGDPEIDLAAMLDVSALLLALSRAGAADADVAAAKLEAVGTMVDLTFDARRAFVEYQATLERLELRRSVFSAFDVAALAAEKLQQAGNVTALRLAREQAAREEARLALTRAEADSLAARERLNGVMGVFGDDTKWQAAGQLPEVPPAELPLERLERDAVLNSLDLAAAKERFGAASKHASAVSTAGWLPELKAGVSAERSEDWGVGPAVELELPLFYQGQGEAGVAKARMKQAEHSYASAAVEVRSSARATGAELFAARSGALHARDVVLPLQARVLEQTQLEYNAMLIGVFELFQAKREQLATAEHYLELRRDYWLRRLDAEQLLAGRRPPR